MKVKLTFYLVVLFCITKSAQTAPYNIAPTAKVTASTILNSSYAAVNIADGIIGIHGKGEWACEGDTTDWGYIRFPWIQLDWDQPQVISKIVLYDRPNRNDHIAGGKLLFSDGSQVWVNEIPDDGTGKAIHFPEKKIYLGALCYNRR